MSESISRRNLFEQPSTWLAVAQFLFLIMMAGYVFAVVETRQETNTETLGVHDELIESNRLKIQEHEIDQAVRNEQYKQIMEELKKLNKKLDER